MANPFPFSAGDVLTAANLNAIGESTSWTPTYSGTTGGTPTVTTNRARYFEINGVAFAFLNIYMSSVGSATGTLQLTLPSGVPAVAANRLVGSGTEVLTTFDTLALYSTSTTQAAINFYDGSTALVAPRVLMFSMAWEIG